MFKIGDKVKIKDCMRDEMCFEGIHFTGEMGKYKGKEFEITNILKGNPTLHILNDDSIFVYHEGMLELIKEEKEKDITDINDKDFKKKREREDVVNQPAHYIGCKGIETIDFIENVLTKEEFIGYLRGNIIKYHARANFKGNKEQDLKKAKAYAERLEKLLGGK